MAWSKNGGWKGDKETFLFSLSNNKKYLKIREDASIFCDKNFGPWFAYIGFFEGSNMWKGKFLYRKSDIYFKEINNIIPNEGKNRFFDVEEVEVYKIIMN